MYYRTAWHSLHSLHLPLPAVKSKHSQFWLQRSLGWFDDSMQFKILRKRSSRSTEDMVLNSKQPISRVSMKANKPPLSSLLKNPKMPTRHTLQHYRQTPLSCWKHQFERFRVHHALLLPTSAFWVAGQLAWNSWCISTTRCGLPFSRKFIQHFVQFACLCLVAFGIIWQNFREWHGPLASNVNFSGQLPFCVWDSKCSSGACVMASCILMMSLPRRFPRQNSCSSKGCLQVSTKNWRSTCNRHRNLAHKDLKA